MTDGKSMTRPKERNELEYLRAENRKLKSENKKLTKSLTRANKETRKYAHAAEEAEELFEDIAPALVEQRHYCPKCRREIDAPKDLGNRTLISCGGCKFKKSFPRKG